MTPTQQVALQALVARTLTAADISALDPLVTERNDAGVAAYLSAGNLVVGAVTRSNFAIWCASTGLRGVIETDCANTTSPLRAISLALRDFLVGSDTGGLDFSNPANAAMMQAWVTAGALTAAQQAALIAMATATVQVPVNSVSNALNKVAP